MKINGKKITGANEGVIVIPRESGDDLVFKIRAVMDMSEFDKLHPEPSPPSRLMANGKTVKNLKDPNHVKACDRHIQTKLNWIVLKSMQATEGLEWETVDIDDANTWDKLRPELKTAGLSDVEINRVINSCIDINALDEEKIEEARDRFLLAQQEQVDE